MLTLLRAFNLQDSLGGNAMHSFIFQSITSLKRLSYHLRKKLQFTALLSSINVPSNASVNTKIDFEIHQTASLKTGFPSFR